MSFEEPTLICSIKMEWINSQGGIHRQLQSKKGVMKLMRNELRDIFMEITADKSPPIRFQLKSLSVHKNFMKEGKATIKFQESGCTIYMTNAPPLHLEAFLRTMFVKMTGNVEKNVKGKSLRTQLLSSKPRSYEEISPVTDAEIIRVQKATMKKSTITTPSPNSRKRKLSETSAIKPPASKRLYESSSPIPREELDIEQKEILEACLTGQNVFFTGSAGTGKSFLLRKIIGALPADVTVATASTGVAACHIGGTTFHQFAGIGLGTWSIDKCVDKLLKSSAGGIWRKCRHLIIDEISMIDADYFQKVEEVARKIRKNDKPFGGIQLVLCGDFFQLPPVKKGGILRFCFESEAWKRCIQRTFELNKVHRQNDPDFIDILNQVRIGKITPESEKILAETARQKIEFEGILATRLCTHTQDADLINETKLKELSGDVKVFEAQDSSPSLGTLLDNQTNVPKKLELKVGTQVMLLKNINISKGLVNGARGVVKDFKNNLPLVQFRREVYLAQPEKWSVKTVTGNMAARKQVPLRLAWAFSIHKSQGLTLDCVEMSLSRVFEAGQAYVALSRARNLRGLRVLDFKATQVWANPNVLDYYNRLKMEEDIFSIVPLGKKFKNNCTNKSRPKSKFNLKRALSHKPIMNIS